MDWKRWWKRLAMILGLWLVMSLVGLSSDLISALANSVPGLIVFWVVMLASIVYCVRWVVVPFFQFVLSNAQKKG